ncbi:MAG: response regulator transcription factor [Anaerolineae bacterium]
MARILVVEDEVALVEVIRTVLESEDHSVLQAFDGQTGLEVALRERPALVIADQMLPTMTGTDLCQALKEENLDPPIPLLLMTAGNVPVGDGCPDRILRKPFSLEELEAVVGEMLQTRAPSFFG